jgi:hypothetical protein
MRLSTKIIICAWIFLIGIIGTLIYSAYSKLRPDSLVALLSTQVQKNYPGSVLSVGEVDYRFALDFNLTLRNLVVRRGESNLASVNELELKVPWWLILLDRGSAQINLSDLIIYVDTKKNLNSDSESDTKKKTPSTQLDFKLPKYLVEAHYTVRAKNISIEEQNGKRSFFTLSKLLVREFQYGKNSAFELKIPIRISHKNRKYSSELWLFGDITPNLNLWALNYRGEFKTKESIEGLHLYDLVLDGKSSFDPHKIDFNSFIDLSADGKKVGSGEVKAKHDELVLKLKLNDFPLDYLNLIGNEIRNPFWKKFEGVAQGELSYNRTFSNDGHSTLTAKLNFPGLFTLSPDQEIQGKWTLNFENEKWESNFITPNGEVSFFKRAVIDYIQGEVRQFSQEIGFNSVALSTALLATDSISTLIGQTDGKFYSTVISFKKCLDGEKSFDGSFRYGISPFERFYHLDLKTKDSSLNLNYISKTSTNQLSLSANNFEWSNNYKFLVPHFQASSGRLNGQLNGSWLGSWDEGKWSIDLKLLSFIDANGLFNDQIQSAWNSFGIDSNGFLERTINVSIDKNVIRLSPLKLNGSDTILLSGALSTAPKFKSYLVVNYPKNKKLKSSRKDITDIFWKKGTL